MNRTKCGPLPESSIDTGYCGGWQMLAMNAFTLACCTSS